MPLVVICGKPCSGKTTAAEKIASFIKAKGKDVTIINLESLKMDPKSAYGTAFDEKNTHEVIKTQVSRQLRSDNFVILDTMNFIKGYRYEMYCIARGCRSTRCVVWIDTPSSAIEAFNAEADHYSKEVLDDLSSRFEPPSPLTRWDTPLFRVCFVKEDEGAASPFQLGLNKQSIEKVSSYVEVPVEEIWDSLTAVKTQAKHLAINPPAEQLSSSDYIGFVNSLTDTIVKDIIHEQTINGGIAGSKLKVSGTSAFVVLYKRVTLLQLKNWRKQYLEIATKQHLSAEQVASSFVQFINTQLKE
ncbi:hypothetical protein WA556_000262, partial [Blastocystis sp. ATCC 50177/Nand II]